MKTPHVLTFLLPLLLPLALSYTLPEDDLVFDDVGEDTSTVSSSTTIIHRHIKKKEDHKADQDFEKLPPLSWNVNRKHQVEKLQSIQDVIATVGHVFKFKIPKETFSGSTNHYEIQGKNGLPEWLSWDEKSSILSGIPGKEDIGSYRLRIKAFGEFGGSAKDTFTIRVQPKTMKSKCVEGQKLMEIKLGVEFESLPPKTKAEAIETFARYLGLPKNSIFLNSSGKHGSKIQWEVGCDGQLWEEQVNIMKYIPKEAKDGTLEEVLQIPVIDWGIRSDSFSRNRRDVGSGDFENPDDYENYDDYGDYEEEEDDEDTESLTESSLPQPYVPGKNKHRHHHGEETIDRNMEEFDEQDIVPIVDQNVLGSNPNISTLSVPSALPSAVVPTEQSGVSSTRLVTIHTTSTTSSPMHVPSTDVAHTTTTNFTEEPMISTTNYNSTTTTAGNFTVGYPTPSITTNTPPTATVVPTTVPTTTSSTISPPTSTPHTTISTGTSFATTVPTTSTSTTTVKTTTMPITTTLPPRITTEYIEYGIHNSPPRQDRRLKKIPVTAGKPLSYIIPSDTFSDAEDGNTRKLKLSIYLQGAPLKSNHWLQFNPHTQEIYGLPLESEISTWDYELVASDSEGLNVSDRLDIHVQQHKSSRTVNHEFSIYLKIEKRSEFPSDVDWKLKVVRDLASLYNDNDIRHITVRSIDTENDQAIFTWTNDSIPRSSECPKEQINALLRVLTDDKGEVPSDTLVRLFAPEIKVKRVLYRGFGQCEDTIGPEPPKVSTQRPKVNFPPIPRNQVDHINATVGQLLVFKVPEDTFFDHEDGSSRNMKMDLFTMDRTPVPSDEWLKFDTKNQEFYGIPMENDVGRKEYQLIVTDKDGATATDGLVVIVSPAPVMRHTVEFWATLLIPYDSFVHSASLKRSFVEKLQQLYQDKDTSAISLHSISTGSTIVVWHNLTLPTTHCAHDEIDRLQSILVNSRTRGVVDRVHRIMGDQFPVNQVSVVPMGICADQMVGVHFPDNHVPPVEDSTSVGAFQENYLITIILPTIIIATMLILAGIIACVLYKRRRSGKMSVSEQDDERQSFRSKGIPVIFQDELDEKPDPGNKSPVILKEEKPPLPPPEYQKTEDGADVPMLPKENSEEPYQPPPPFATNRDTNRQNRPKPTPAYRTPPPYVPP